MAFTHSPKLYPFRGKMLPASAISRVTGISIGTIRDRGEAGQPVDVPRRSGPLPKLYEFRGEQMTADAIGTMLGVDPRTVRNRAIGNRIAEDEELDRPRSPQCNSTLVFMDGETDTLSGWARRKGINASTVFNRVINLGWPPVDALTKPIGPSANGRAIRVRNRIIIIRIATIFRISRMIAGFRSSLHPSTTMTGGDAGTFANPLGTGAGRHASHLQSGETA